MIVFNFVRIEVGEQAIESILNLTRCACAADTLTDRYSCTVYSFVYKFCVFIILPLCIGLVLKANKRYSQRVTKAFHVSQATLDLKTLNANDSDGVVQVWLFTDDADHLLANVSRQNSHVQLDLAFTEGETVAFYSKGSGTVHLSGYLLPDEEDDFPHMGDEEGEEEEDER